MKKWFYYGAFFIEIYSETVFKTCFLLWLLFLFRRVSFKLALYVPTYLMFRYFLFLNVLRLLRDLEKSKFSCLTI